jgi:glycine cleavage system aminomethyltransferase T
MYYKTTSLLTVQGPKAWGKFEKLVESSQQKLDLKG